jgi:hypothetical protein
VFESGVILRPVSLRMIQSLVSNISINIVQRTIGKMVGFTKLLPWLMVLPSSAA